MEDMAGHIGVAGQAAKAMRESRMFATCDRFAAARLGGLVTEHRRISGEKVRRAAATAVRGRRKRTPRHRYFAFLSYSHKDEELADWLHRELEDFRVPSALVGKITEHGVVPRRLTPIFRDQHELAAADDLTEEIEQALSGSQYLIVLCSPDAAASHWTNAEIETFKRSRPDGCVLAAIASGEPFASEVDGQGSDECFPPALRQKYDRLGRPTGKRSEPLAADLRPEGGGRRLGFLKLVAGMLGVGLDDLVQRENTRRQRRLAWLAAASISGMALTSLLAIAAIQARDAARDQRREAEGLVAFMLGDLKDKLEPIGRLDALDGVGAKVLDYYRRQDTRDLPDDALLQRSKALSLSAQVAYLRGDLNTSLRLFHEAAEGTEEAVKRSPEDPERLFEHAQNVYYFGDIAAQRGDYAGAAAAFTAYKNLADKMVAIAPNNLKYRTEVQYANVNLGVVLRKQRRFAEASARFTKALDTIDAIAAIDPANRSYQRSMIDLLGWLADSESDRARLEVAKQVRERQVRLLSRISPEGANDVGFLEQLIPARLKLGRLYAASGDRARAVSEIDEAVAIASRLTAQEPDNRKWLEYEAIARLTRAQLALETNTGGAKQETDAACAIVKRLVARDSSISGWQLDDRDCLMLRARSAMASRNEVEATTQAQQALAIATKVKTGDPIADRYLAAQSYRLLGDVYRRFGDSQKAADAWRSGLAQLPAPTAERPGEEMERAYLLERNGNLAEASRISEGLRNRGVRFADILSM